MIRGALLFGLAVTAAAFMPSLWTAAAALVFVGMSMIGYTTVANSLLQLESSPEMRGRVMGFWTICILGSSTIGAPIVGWVGEALGPRWALALGGLAALTAAALGARLGTQPQRHRSDMPPAESAARQSVADNSTQTAH
jgi:MFS family permease